MALQPPIRHLQPSKYETVNSMSEACSDWGKEKIIKSPIAEAELFCANFSLDFEPGTLLSSYSYDFCSLFVLF